MEVVRKIFHQGEAYTPVFDGGRMLTLHELESLGAETVEDAPERLARAILITNEPPKLKQWTKLPATHFDVPADCPLVFGDTHLAIGMIEDVESINDSAIGPHLRAVVKFLPTRLGEICYRGMVAGTLSGCCSVILWGERRGIELGIIQEVRLGAIEDSCLKSARIWPNTRGSTRLESEQERKRGDIMALLPPIKRPRPIKLPDAGTGSVGLPPPVIKRPTAK